MDTTHLQPETQTAPASGEVGKLFRSAVRGFHKQDVTEYIERMARDRRRDAERYSAHIRSLEEERTATAQDLAALRAQTAKLTSEAYAARQEKEENEHELVILREANGKLEHDVAELTRKLETFQETAVPEKAAAELEKVRGEAAEKDEKIVKLSAALQDAQREKVRLERELEALRRRQVPSAAQGGTELMNRVRSKAPTQANELAAMRSRIERARQCAKEGLSECHSLYHEMRRNMERLEEILRDLND